MTGLGVDKSKLFVASCVSLVITAMVFAIRITERTFDDFAETGVDHDFNRKLLGLT